MELDSSSRAETRKGVRRLMFERMNTGSVKLRKNKITGPPGSGSSEPGPSNSASFSPSFRPPSPCSSRSGGASRVLSG